MDTKKPLGSPGGLKVALIVSIGVEYHVAPDAFSKQNYVLLAYPLLINIIPYFYVCWKALNLYIINHKVYRALMSIVNSEKLIDYSEKDDKGIRKVLYGVKIVYERTQKGVYLTFYTRDIKNSEVTTKLIRRLEEAFNMNVLSVDPHLTYTKYLLRNVDRQRMEVTSDEF